MSRRLALAHIAAIAILFCASAAQSKTISVTIGGQGTLTSGACLVQGYGNICRSGTCECLSVQTGKVRGSFTGSGEVFATIDTGIDSGQPALACRPMFVTATTTLSNKHGSKTAVLDITAAYCQKNGSFVGSWGIESASDGSTGGGTVSGADHLKTGKVSMTLKGTIH
jgi:hypothetical protein